MAHPPGPSLTIALATAFGMLGTVVAHHIRLPAIVLLLCIGVGLGPDGIGWIHPEYLGSGLNELVGFAVAVILFEGGMALDKREIVRAPAAIPRLITIGAMTTMVGGALAAHYIMGWGWQLAILFGTLVIVTGPTVIGPLMKRWKVEHQTATILEAEGVLTDPVGAIIAAVALDTVLAHNESGWTQTIEHVFGRISFGFALGALAGYLMSRVLRKRGLIPEGLENVFTLAMVWATFQLSNLVLEESGIAAVTIAGVTVAWLGTPVDRDLKSFKEQLTVMMIGLLFVLLAADVRLEDVAALGIPGLLTVLALVVLVRPATALISSVGTRTTWAQRLFISWIGPRGIVAAAVASLFALRMSAAGMEGGTELRALVFLTIAITVGLAGTTGGILASRLNLRRGTDRGWVILGSHALAQLMGRCLADAGEEVVLVDANPVRKRKVEAAGLQMVVGNAMAEEVLESVAIDERTGTVAMTRNQEVNLLFTQRVREHAREARTYVAVREPTSAVAQEVSKDARKRLLFGANPDIDAWAVHMEDGDVVCERRRLESSEPGDLDPGLAIPLLVERHGRQWPVGERSELKTGDYVTFAIDARSLELAASMLESAGWVAEDHKPT